MPYLYLTKGTLLVQGYRTLASLTNAVEVDLTFKRDMFH